MNKTITTIIPFFNSGNDLSRMIDSILKGTVLPSELLLIDDGSSDESVTLAKDYANRHSFIKYVKQNHAGVSAARNLGIELATGEWISFLDADDYVEPNTYELMLNAIADESFDGCVCGYFTEVDQLSTAYIGEYPDSLTSEMLLKAMFTDDNVRGFLFTKLFKASIVKNAAFDGTISMCEDLLFQTTLLKNNPNLKFAYVSQPLYHYVQNSSSATNKLNLFNGSEFKYKPAFDQIRKMLPEQYVEDSYNSILEYSMYRLLKAYQSGDSALIPQIRLLQKELKAVKPSNSGKRRLAYMYAPIIYSKLMK
ncbi:Glycosyl transferase family 2 [Pseudobutyrivibrio sp. YE44]|uniref:glycosyltransferase family 2 protein n=1 Tax=Pseudobutyrivibrio sp. YE44 TaxID=1520802 RepID=UPI0008890E43|nr:glycosyltransferase family A protein [Pseudobutyrivibrio sp. YE44]SDB46654.1 Glycosyl transferase family 2 [Pseudobutyrivibrio sp. YE44]